MFPNKARTDKRPVKHTLYCVFRRTGSLHYGKYSASLRDDTTGKPIGSGSFPTVTAVKTWARQWAKAKDAKLKIEGIR